MFKCLKIPQAYSLQIQPRIEFEIAKKIGLSKKK